MSIMNHLKIFFGLISVASFIQCNARVNRMVPGFGLPRITNNAQDFKEDFDETITYTFYDFHNIRGVNSVPNQSQGNSEGFTINTKNSTHRKVFEGKQPDPKDWPWMATILKNTGTKNFCGGTLITDRHILTAAHCVVSIIIEDIFVRLGECNYNTPDVNNPTDFRVEDIITHQGYDQNTFENDIAIMKLSSPTTFSAYIHPVSLPPPDNDFVNLLGFVTGLELRSFGGPTSTVSLQEVVIPVWKQKDCVAAYPENKVTDSMMCAGLKAGGKDFWQGDSGSPFLIQIFPESEWHLAGVVSWGIKHVSENRPGVYTRVNRYLDWIKQNTVF